MKIISTSLKFFFIIGLLLTISLKAESEPNNTYQQANQLVPNATSSGALNEATQSLNADNDDWWQITLSSDGSLYCSTSATSNLDVDLYIYDIGGNNIIATGSRYGSTESVYHVALKAGTYFIRAYRGGGTGNYSIQTIFTVAPYANDSEPNNSYEIAQTLNLNSETTGHIKYFSNGSWDYDDYWKVTIPYDGILTVSTESDSADIDLYIYDINGANIIKSASAYGLTETIQYPNLAPGVYYVRAYCASSHGGYKITSEFTQTAINGNATNDSEINDESSTAVNWLTFNNAGTGTSYGHLGYYSNNYTDYSDYWAITTTTDGKLVINTESTSSLDVDLYIYDVNGSSIIKTASSYGITEQAVFENLATGKYFVRAYSTGYGSYKITAEFSTTSMANDVEPNDETAQALSISPETRMTGHLGYYSNNHTDSDDYYVINLSSNWDSLYIRLDSEASLDADIYLNNSSSNVISSASSYGTNDIIKYGAITAGIYYIRVYRSLGQGSYAIKFSNHYLPNPLTDVKKEEIEILPTSYLLSQNYPNPFNPSTTIKYDLPQNSNVTLKVYDVLGNEVSTLVNGNQTAGSYTVNFKADNLSSGIYFYRIEAGKFSQVKKFILMK